MRVTASRTIDYAVQNELANCYLRHELLWPDFGGIKDAAG